MKSNNIYCQKGFSLIELVIVCAMLGIVMAAIFTLYQTHQRTAYTQEEVVEVQQNLRIAMDSITRDIKMAGFLVPLTPAVINPIASFTNGATNADPDSITINTASESGVYARIDAGTTSTAGGDTIFTVASTDSTDGFNTTTNKNVRIIRPQDGSQPITILANQIMAVNGTTATTLTIATSEAVNFLNGDMIVRTTAGAANPNTVQYAYSAAAVGTTCTSNCLTRVANGTTNVVANNITNLQFSYILDDNTETDAPADMSTIRAVRVTITGATVTTTALSGGQAKTRQIASVVRIRNRRF